MARQPDVQYIRCYIDGSAARKLEPVAPAVTEKTIRMPAQRVVKRRLVYVDPVAIFGIVVAVCMLITILSGVVMLKQARLESAAMQQTVVELSRENDRLQRDYEAGYDLSDIEQKALSLGMVPVEQVDAVRIDITAPQAEEVPMSLWERVSTFLTGLFA